MRYKLTKIRVMKNVRTKIHTLATTTACVVARPHTLRAAGGAQSVKAAYQ